MYNFQTDSKIDFLKSRLDSFIDDMLRLNDISDSTHILISNLNHWNKEYDRIDESEKTKMKNIVLVEAISCMRATVVSLCKIDSENKDLYLKALDCVQGILSL